jgi:hypothetical protein
MNEIKITKYGIVIDEKIFDENLSVGDKNLSAGDKNLSAGDKNSISNNINGPCIIKVPEFIENPLGKYYLYFGHHKGTYIRMAYSNNILGPYTLFKPGILDIKDTPGYDHIASPDVVIDFKNKRLILYYHCVFNNGKTPQSTFYAYSTNGLNFQSHKINILYPYFRYFTYHDSEYGIAMYKHIGSIILKKNGNEYEEFSELLPKSRHTSVMIINDKIYIFYTIVGDCPEHIYYCQITNLEKNNVKTTEKISLVKPEFEYEHNNQKPIISCYGPIFTKINQLRDPYIFFDNDNFYIFYTVCGEKGIAVCRVENFYK